MNRVKMGQVFVACKKCGTRFSTRQFVDRDTYKEGRLEPGRYQCPQCETTLDYTPTDYEYSD